MKLTTEQRAELKAMSELRAGTSLGDALDADLEEAEALEVVIEDHQRLVREMDVILCGEAGAARQASLCDLVGYVKDQLAGKPLFAMRKRGVV